LKQIVGQVCCTIPLEQVLIKVCESYDVELDELSGRRKQKQKTEPCSIAALPLNERVKKGLELTARINAIREMSK
jgi:chromosomal replication initiation ATPase DnaA